MNINRIYNYNGNQIEDIKYNHINNNNCLCRKNKFKGLLEQCPFKKKIGEQYCGRHCNENRWRINVYDSLNNDNLKNYCSFITKPIHKNEIITIKDYYENKKLNYTCSQLKDTLNFYNLKTTGKKNELQKNLSEYFNSLIPYYNDIDKIIYIQNFFRNYRKKRNIRLRGPGYLDRLKCNNQEDFFTFEPIEKIEDEYFFSFKDTDNFIYAFDINSFKKLIEMKMNNPYNRNPIPKKAIKNMKKLFKFNNFLNQKEDIEELNENQKMNQRVINVFQKIDELGIYAGGADINWFLELNNLEMKNYYKKLEDIWNYRAELNLTQKHNIVKDKQMFPVSVHNFYKLNNINKMRNITLKEIEKLIFTADSNNDKCLGCYYVLSALCEVSIQCAESMPWLAQAVM